MAEPTKPTFFIITKRKNRFAGRLYPPSDQVIQEPNFKVFVGSKEQILAKALELGLSVILSPEALQALLDGSK